MKNTRAYIQGRRAYRPHLIGVEENPYDYGPAASQWYEGWLASEAEENDRRIEEYMQKIVDFWDTRYPATNP